MAAPVSFSSWFGTPLRQLKKFGFDLGSQVKATVAFRECAFLAGHRHRNKPFQREVRFHIKPKRLGEVSAGEFGLLRRSKLTYHDIGLAIPDVLLSFKLEIG